MRNLNLRDLPGNEHEPDSDCGANLPRATRKELLKMRISTLATSILAMTERALRDADRVGETDLTAPATRASPANGAGASQHQRQASKKKHRPSATRVVTDTDTHPSGASQRASPQLASGAKSKRAGASPVAGRTTTPSQARAPTSTAEDEDRTTPGQKPRGTKSNRKGSRGKQTVSPTSNGDARVGAGGVSPTVEGASFEEVVRTLKALESPHASTADRVTRQLRWASLSPEGQGGACGPETPIVAAARLTSTTTTHLRETEEAFEAWLSTSAADSVAALGSAGELLYDRCMALSVQNSAVMPSDASTEATTRPLSVQEVTESLHRLTVPDPSGDLDEAVEENADHARSPTRTRREPRYYEVIYMLLRACDSNVSQRAGLGAAAASGDSGTGGSVDREAEEVDENAQALRRLEKLYAKSVFATGPPPHVTAAVSTAGEVAATGADDDTNHAQNQYQLAVMDLLQSSTSEPVYVRLGPLSCARRLLTADTAAAAARGRYSTELSPCDSSPPLATTQTFPNSSESSPLLLPDAADHRSAHGSSGNPLPRGARVQDRQPSREASGAITADDNDAESEDASGAHLAIQRIETWQKHREDVVASRIVRRRRSSVSGLALPSAEFYYTSSSVANLPSIVGDPHVRTSGEYSPTPAERPVSAELVEDAASASGSVARDTSAASESAVPTISSPSWTNSSCAHGGGTLTATSAHSHMQPSRPQRRSSAANHSVSSGTTNNVLATSSAAAQPNTAYDVLLSASVYPSTTSANGSSAPAVAADTPSVAEVEDGSTAGAAHGRAATRSQTRQPQSTTDDKAGLLDVIVASDYLTTPHLQMIWQTEQEDAAQEPTMTLASAAALPSQALCLDTGHGHAGEAGLLCASGGDGAPLSHLNSVGTPAIDNAATANSIEREASTVTLSPLGPPIVL